MRRANSLEKKNPDAGKDWSQEEKGLTEDETVGRHHRLNGHEFEQTLGGREGQRSRACCSPESDTTERVNSTNRGCQSDLLMCLSTSPMAGPGLLKAKDGLIHPHGTSPCAPRNTRHAWPSCCWMLQMWIKLFFNRQGDQSRGEGTHPWLHCKLGRHGVGPPGSESQRRRSWAHREDRHLMSPISPTKATGKAVYGLAANQGHKHFHRPQSNPVNYFCL